MTPLLSKLLLERRYQIVRPFMQGDILDLGCGYAKITELLEPGQVYMGVEGSPNVFEWLKLHKPDYVFLKFDLDRDRIIIDRQFDTILMVAVLEHLANPTNIIRQLPQFIKPGGHLVITTPTPLGNMIHTLGANVRLFYKEAARDHKKIYNRASLTRLLQDCSFNIIHYQTFLLFGNQLSISQLATGKK